MTDARAWGVEPGYEDAHGTWREVPQPTVAAILDAMGAAEGMSPPLPGPDDPVLVVRAGDPVPVDGHWHVRTEDGATIEGDGPLPHLPLGYHTLVDARTGASRRLVVSPGRCHPAGEARRWGWAVQLHSLRSAGSTGMGDLEDLRRWGRFSSAQGAGLCLLNPLHAALPGLPQQPSPYFPSSRCFRNPLYLRVPGAPSIEACQGGERPLIDRDAVWRAKLPALERRWAEEGASPPFERYRAEQGAALEGYATFCALCEVHGRPWTSWPDDVRRPGGAGVAPFAAEHADRVAFHAWLQWLVDGELAAAGSEIDIVHDLAIGVDPAGADAWWWQDAFALGMRVGAPPDEFNAAGQDWGLPPLDPWRLRQAAYEPFIRTVRAGLRHAGGLRVDHVMGLFRLFWIPEGAGPAQGAYVRYPWRELLGILALESVRAGAFVVGEDLGTVEPWVREELAARGVLSYRLLWFEDGPPEDYPAQALAAVTTHDLPTVAGVWKGTDPGDGVDTLRERLVRLVDLPPEASTAQVVAAAYARLALAPSAVVVATVEDALEVEQRPNMPGTTEASNWSTPLPCSLEDIEADPRVAAVAEAMGGRTAEQEPA